MTGPNFVLLDATLPDVARLLSAAVQARDAVETRSWSYPQEPTTEEWWADVLADPRAQIRKRRSSDLAVAQTFYRLADELRDTILVACSKCDWKAAFRRDELITAHGAACPMPSLLGHLAPPLAAPRSARNGTAAACITSRRLRAKTYELTGGDARGRYGDVREELAVGVKEKPRGCRGFQ